MLGLGRLGPGEGLLLPRQVLAALARAERRPAAVPEVVDQGEADQPPELDDRVRVIVDPDVDRPVVEAAVAAAGARHQEHRRLLAAAVAAGGVTGGEGGVQTLGERLPGAAEEGLLHRRDHRLAGQDVALHRVAGAAASARPGVAARTGEGRRAAVRRDDADLALTLARASARVRMASASAGVTPRARSSSAPGP